MLRSSISAILLLLTNLSFAETSSRYFIVQNVATEKMRVYERCTQSESCPHRLVFETEMVAGKIDSSSDLWTRVGVFKVDRWVKYYEDGGGLYPSWYDPNYPATPPAGNSFGAWTEKRAMPKGEGSVRGAFGWYAALLTPNPHGQWIHGTIGWGSDGDKFIKQTRGFLANLFADPRSHGCTRLENRAIAFVQSFLPEGSDVFRVYALENFVDEQLTRYENQKNSLNFDFILTKDQVRKEHPNTSARSAVVQRLENGDITSADILEEGNYSPHQYPTLQPLTNKRASSGKSGDTYSLGKSAFKGVFLVDEGRFKDYQHPAQMPRGGITGNSLPNYILFQ